jgi:hypothetical protein
MGMTVNIGNKPNIYTLGNEQIRFVLVKTAWTNPGQEAKLHFQWLGSFGNRGNGRYRTELRQGLTAIRRYLTAHRLPQERALLRLDGQYGTGAVLSDVGGFAFVTRGKDYMVLDHPLVSTSQQAGN